MTTTRLDTYLEAFTARLKQLALAQGFAVLCVVAHFALPYAQTGVELGNALLWAAGVTFFLATQLFLASLRLNFPKSDTAPSTRSSRTAMSSADSRFR